MSSMLMRRFRSSWIIRGETVQINDMGHEYSVNTNVLYVQHEENGFIFVMDVRQVADKVVGVLFKD